MKLLSPMLGSGSPPIPGFEHAALLIVDRQNAYCHPEGLFARNAPDPLICQHVIAPCARLIDAARRRQVPVLHAAKVSLTPDISTVSFHNTRRQGTGMMLVNDWDAAIADELCPATGEVVLYKLAYSAFYGTVLDAALLRLGTRQLILAGVTTSICVESTARDAAHRGLDVYVVRDATAEWDSARYERSIEQMSYAFARIPTVQQVVDAWRVTPG